MRLAGFGPSNRPQRKNGTVIKTCKQCGASHGAEATSCYVCRTLLSQNDDATRVRNGGLVRPNGPLVAPDWRGEVHVRMQEYRKRQNRLRQGPSQPELVFSEEARAEIDEPVTNVFARAPSPLGRPIGRQPAPVVLRGLQVEVVPHAPPPMSRRVSRVERLEIDLIQPSLDFSSEPTSTHVSLVAPMASLHERQMAAALDGGLLLFSFGSFVILFSVLGGRFMASKTDAMVLVATLGLFYAQYFALFTFFSGATPGMMWRGLCLATFDGREPQPRERAWRSFGYLVSAGTLMLGFLWALWDEDHLSWHDRISHTHLTWIDSTAGTRYGADGYTDISEPEPDEPQFASASFELQPEEADIQPAGRVVSRY